MDFAHAGHFFKALQDNAEMQESDEFPGELETDVAAFIDPRTSQMGVRVICVEDSLEIDDSEIVRLDSSHEYDLIRMMLGIPEGSSEIGNQFPLNMHLHYLNGVSFEKGCYIGQELTQRTFHTGVIRRVALPFMIVSKPEDRNSNFEINAGNFMPIQHIDKNFDLEIKGEEI